MGLYPEPEAVQLVGKQQFVAAQRRDGDRCVQRLQHGSKTLIGSRQLFPNTVGFGDVRHRRHPASLCAARVNQWRYIQTGIEQAAVLAFHADLNTAGGRVARQFFVQYRGERLTISLGPIRKWSRTTHQIRFCPARHLAKRCVDIGDAPLQVHRPHAGEHGVFHGTAEVGFRYKGLLCLNPSAGMPPVSNQHPCSHGAQGDYQPEKAATHYSQ